MSVRLVQGFLVKSASLTSKGNQVKLVLQAEKDEIRAGSGTLADVLVSLEYHSTGADSSPISATLQGSPYDFYVDKVVLKQDNVETVLKTEKNDGDDANLSSNILAAIARHSASKTAVEISLAANDV